MKLRILIPLLFIFSTVLSQTEKLTKTTYKDTSQIDKLSARISYYGINTFHAGLKIGVEYPIKRKIIEKPRIPRKYGLKVIHKEWIASINLTGYYHKNNHTGFWLNPELSRRRTGRRGGFKEFSYGIGFLKTFQPKTYIVNDDGSVDKVFMPGHGFFTISLGIAYGKDYSVKKNKPLCWYIKPNYYLIFPYNTLFNMGFGFEVGITYKFLSNPFLKK
ncbi:MAG: hypothetical protein A2033_00620 [Bacteroidetes bacterium GWA2_31_9]|nr:MAG: hypothetical protein A2033_00620 [Bacteroidetes bacterium GWA2_31_9]